MPVDVPKYPVELTKANWNSKKAKLTPSTGIGEELDKLEKAYSDIKWQQMTLLKSAKGPTELKIGIEAVKKHFPAIETYRKKLFAFETVADKKAAEAKKAKLFPSSSRVLIENMSKIASNFATLIRDTPAMWQKDAEKTLEGYEERLAKKIQATKVCHKAMAENWSKAEDLGTKTTEKIKEAIASAKKGGRENVEAGKNLLNDAAKLLSQIEKLVAKCESDSKVWRTEKSEVGGEDMKQIATLANEIMQFNKNTFSAAKKSKEAITKTMEVLAKLK